MNKKTFLIGCAAFICTTLTAQTSKESIDSTKVNILKEAVVSGTKFKVPIEKSSKTIYKISSKSIEQNAGKTVVDILNEIPGIQMGGNFGAPGSNISIYQRGGRNKNTLILIDGVPLNDPTGITASYDLRLLSLNTIESIEVLNGGLSTLYGTGASSGVINITLKEPTNNKINGAVDFNYGSFNTYNTSANINGKLNKFNYLLSGNYSLSDGFSAASDENSDTPFNPDGFDQKNLLLKAGYKFNENFKIDGLAGYDDIESEYDGGAFFDQDNLSTGNMFRIGLTPTFKYNNGSIDLKSMYVINDREQISQYPSSYMGKSFQLDLTQKHKFSNNVTGLWGLNSQSFSYEQEDVISFEDTKFSLFDPYASVFYQGNSGFNFHLGARLNTHSVYDSKFVYNINPSYLFKFSQNLKVKVLASASTSYITPSGYQLYSASGNLDLKPEDYFSLEFGGSIYLNKNLILNAVYFDRTEKNVIDYASTFDDQGNWTGGQYINLDSEREVNGVEIDLTYNISKKLAFAANYSHAEAKDPTTFYRIPNDKYGARLDYSLSKNTSINAKYNYTGSRTVFDYGSYSEIDLESYGLVDIYAQHQLFKNKLTAYGAVNNLFDTDFIGLYGYTTKGINYNIGFKYNF